MEPDQVRQCQSRPSSTRDESGSFSSLLFLILLRNGVEEEEEREERRKEGVWSSSRKVQSTVSRLLPFC